MESEEDGVSPLERRARRVLPVVAVASFLCALSIHGWLGPALDYSIALGLAALVGAVAFAFLGDGADRVVDAVAGALVGAWCTYAVGFYLNDHRTIFNLVVIVALLVGALPGAVIFVVLRALRQKLAARVLIALAALIATLVVLGLRDMRVEADGSLRRARELERLR
jgi:hypothetical protein